MHKYTGKTYSKARKREAKSAVIFDDVQNGETSTSNADTTEGDSSKTPFGSSFPKKSSWSRVHRAVVQTQENSPTKNAAKTSKRRLDTIDEDDPFAFIEDDLQSTSLPSSQKSSQKSVDPSDKSTDDEAYSSSQESINEASSKSNHQSSKRAKRSSDKSSPFKCFLKNNDKSLSPVKNKNLRRLSALPTNMNVSDEEMSEESEPEAPAIVRSSSWPQTTNKMDQEGVIKVKRKEKPLFTVIRNVKKMSECLESGEDQEFFDDIEYLLDGIQSPKPQTRCLSALDIASRCTSASFRINLRAHGIIPKIFKLLEDAHKDKNLALCTSAIMFVLTQDKQNIDFDKFVLEMMMNFLSVSEVEDTQEKNHLLYVQKARAMFEKHMSRIPGAFLDLKDISASSLARESLLSITTDRIGSWFKEEIRTLGGIDHIVNAVTECVNWLAEVHGNCIQRDQDSQAKIQRINKSLKLLENITSENAVNQKYLIQYHNGVLATDLARFIKLCIDTITSSPNTDSSSSTSDYIYNEATLDDCMFNTIKVFLNLSNDCDEGSNLIGEQQELLSSLLFCVLQLPQHLESNKRFDLHVLSLGLLINLVEHSKNNISTLVQLKTDPCHESQDTSNDSLLDSDGMMGSVEALMQLFIVRERSARDTDQMTNALSPEDEEDDNDVLRPTKDGLGWICGNEIDVSINEANKSSSNNDAGPSSSPKKNTKAKNEENLEDEIGKALVIANKHMEDSMVASYVALLLGCIVQGNKANELLVRSLLPDKDFSLLIDVLKKFLGFMRLTSGTSGHAIEKILKVLQKCSETTE